MFSSVIAAHDTVYMGLSASIYVYIIEIQVSSCSQNKILHVSDRFVNRSVCPL